MPKKYIDFINDRTHSPRVFNNPVHNGKIPPGHSSVEGIRVNGEIEDFVDAEIPERVHRALLAGKKINRAGHPLDCLWFAVLMDKVDHADKLASGDYAVVAETGEERVDPCDQTQDFIVNIGRGFHDQRFSFVHSAYPTRTFEGAQYIHKLGDSGPLCLSGLQDAINIFHGSGAYPMNSYELERKQASD